MFRIVELIKDAFKVFELNYLLSNFSGWARGSFGTNFDSDQFLQVGLCFRTRLG